MTKGMLMEMLVDIATDYVKTAKTGLKRNGHMNEMDKEELNNLTQNQIDAVVVDFINVVGTFQGMDLGLYTHYLYDKEENETVK